MQSNVCLSGIACGHNGLLYKDLGKIKYEFSKSESSEILPNSNKFM